MDIIAHRGYWKTAREKNSLIAFRRALQYGFGIETDFRDYGSQIVISHDMPSRKCMRAEDFFALYREMQAQGTLALNIKSDGLTEALQALLLKFDIENYFCFDMSVPDTLKYISAKLRSFARISEYESTNAKLLKASRGVWLDMFISDWPKEVDIQNVLAIKKGICFVSPELHRRDHLLFWKKLLRWKKSFARHKDFHLCTDYPNEARDYFAQ